MADDPLGLAQLPKVQVPAADTPKPEALFGLVTGVVIVSGLYLARDVLIPITLAVVLSFFLAPIVKLLQRARLPKVAAVIVAVLAALAVILLVGAIIASQIKALVGNLPQYLSTVNEKIEWGHRAINTAVTQVTSRLGTLHELPAPAPGSVSGAVAGTCADSGHPRVFVDQLSRDGAPDSGAHSLASGHARHRYHRHNLHPHSPGGSPRSFDKAFWLE